MRSVIHARQASLTNGISTAPGNAFSINSTASSSVGMTLPSMRPKGFAFRISRTFIANSKASAPISRSIQ